MFPYQRAAVGLSPDYVIGVGCHICTATCYDTGCGWSCFYSGGCRYESCQISQTVLQAQVQPGDPVEALRALRNQLEAQIAAVEAQERVLKEQRDRQQGGGSRSP